jgi:hypothetical protein
MDTSTKQQGCAFAASAALHAVVIFVALWSARMPLPVTPMAPLKLLDLTLPKNNTLLDSEEGAPPCADGKSYWGIGMQFNLNNIVINAPESYPAYHAGIRVGDVVTDRDIHPDEQGYETVEFTRRGKLHRLRIKTEWICLR